MEFRIFSKTLRTHIGGGKNASDYAREMFFYITIPNAETAEILDLDEVTYKKYATGGRTLKSFSQKILPYIDKERFADYLMERCSLAVSANMIEAFANEGFVTCQADFIDDVTDLFCSFIRTAAISGRSTPKSAEVAEDANVRNYLMKLREKFYSTKTLLYTVVPKPINDFYVPNDLYDPQYKSPSKYGHLINKEEDKKHRISADKVLLSFKKHFIVITGTGGLGKSMLMHYLVLNMIKNYDTYKKIPIVIYLRSYKPGCDSLLTFIQAQVPSLNLTDHLENGSCVFLLDGMDEIKSDYIKMFEKQLSEMADKYPSNYFIMTSRPISEFISLNRFAVYALAPFTKEQALELIDCLEYRPEAPELKENFRKALDEKLFDAHKDFAEIPLLLTILLMTYERHARIPAKLHMFYKQAFETLVEKHDATKIGFDRVYATKMFPEEFVTVLEEFCTRAYFNEDVEFSDMKFEQYFGKLKCLPDLIHHFSCSDLKKDMTNNLCLMYYDGGVFRYIHRTFQDYFCASFVSKSFDIYFSQIWKSFEKLKNKTIDDHTFEMLYDMNQPRTEQLILIPFLEDLFERCKADTLIDEYWNFLEIVYPVIHYSDGMVHYSYDNEPFSYIYLAIIKKLGTLRMNITEGIPYEPQLEKERYLLVEENGEEVIIAAEDYDEREDYEYIDICGHNCTIDVAKARHENGPIHDLLIASDFPYWLEYHEVKRLLVEMQERKARYSSKPDDLFEDIFG